MLRGRVRRRVNTVLVFVVAGSLVVAAGPSLAMADLTVHVVVGVAFLLATAGHLWLHRDRMLSWPASGRLGRRPRTRVGWMLKGQDAAREWLFVATVISGVVLMAGGPGEHVHAAVGFALVTFAVAHAWLHRAWFRRSLQRSGENSLHAGSAR